MNRVIDNLFEKDETLVVLSLENNDHGFLNALKHQLIFLSFDELENLQQFTYFKMGIICYFDAQTRIDILYNWVLNILYQANSSTRVKWFVIVPQCDISEYFLVFWRFEFLNVVVLAHYTENNDTSFQIFTGDPQDPVNNCGRNFNTANQQDCHSNLTFEFNVPRKFNGCTFRTCSAYPTRTVKQTELAVSESIMEITATYLNASYEFYFANSCPPAPFTIIFSFLRLDFLHAQNTMIFYSSKPVWAVPKPKKIDPFKVITLIFKNTVWILILLSIFITTFSVWLLIKYNNYNYEFLLILLEIWQITLFGSINKLPWQWTLRFVFISYIVYCIHIQAVFASKIIELLTVPQYERGIQNVRELSESNLSIIVSKHLKKLFFDQFNLEYDSVSSNINRLLRSDGNRNNVAKFLDCLKTEIGCAAFFIGDEDYFNDSISEVAHLISENSVVEQHTNDELHACVNRVIDNVFAEDETLVVLSFESNDHSFLKGLKHQLIFLSFDELKNLQQPTYFNMGIICYFDSQTHISILKLWFRTHLFDMNSNPKVKWFVIAPRHNISEYFLYFWSFEFLDVVVLAYYTEHDESYFQIITSDPQDPLNNCGKNFNSANQQHCHSNLRFEFNVQKKFNNCTFRICSAYPTRTAKQTELAVSESIMRITATYLHASYEFDVGNSCPPPFKIINSFLRLPDLYSQNTIIFYSSKPVWAVPKPKKIDSFKVITLIFKNTVWILILLSIFITTFSVWLLIKYNNYNYDFLLILLEIWQITLFGSINKLPWQWTLRFVFISYIVYCIHIQAVFASKIVELLTVPQYERGIQNVRELSESNLSIIVREDIKIIFFDQFNLEYDNISNKITRLLRSADNGNIDEIFLDCLKTDEACAAFFIGDEHYLDNSISEIAHLIWENSVVGSIKQHANDEFHACVNRVIDNVFAEDETLVVLSFKSNDHSFLNGLKHQLIFFSFDELEILQESHYFKMGIICYFDQQTTIDVLEFWFPNLLYEANANPSIKWFVIAPRPNIAESFLFFWKLEFHHVVVLGYYTENNATSFQIFTSDPLDPLNNCGRNFNSVNQQNCHSNLTFKFKVQNKFNKCTLRICSAHPTKTVKQTELAVSESIMKITATYLNTSYEFGVGNLCRPLFKIVNAFLRLQNLYSQNTIIFYSSKPVWAVPKPKKIHPFKVITLIFKNTVWVLILLSILITTFSLWLLIKYNNYDHEFLLILLEVWQITLFGSINKLPWQWTLRFVIISYIVYCIHIQAVFGSKIIELLTVPQYERGIQNVRELSESNLSIIIRNELKIMFFDQFDLEYDDVSNKINKLLYSAGRRDVDEVFFDCIKTDEGCAAFFIGDEDYLDESISEVAHLIWENSVVGSISYVFFTLKHSYLFESINQIVCTLIESGITDYFIKKHETHGIERVFSNNTDTKTILTVGHLHIVFVFWANRILEVVGSSIYSWYGFSGFPAHVAAELIEWLMVFSQHSLKYFGYISGEQHTNDEFHACVNRVIDNVFAEDETLVVLSFESNDHSFLKGLKQQLIFFSFDELENLQESHYFKMGIICYFDDQTTIDVLEFWFPNILYEANANPSVKWFVIAPRPNIAEYFLFFWKFEFHNVVVLGYYRENNPTSFQIFTSDPLDHLNNCGRNFNSVNQQNCHSNLTFNFKVQKKFNKCTLRMCSVHPTKMVKQTELAVSESIMKITATYLNTSYEFGVGKVCRPLFQIVNAFLRLQNLYSQNTIIFYSSKPVWAVPKPKKIHPFKVITLIFKNTVWVLILLSIFITTFSVWLLIKYNNYDHEFLLILLEVWQITLFGSINKLPWQWTLRFVFISYIVYCIHIQAVFASKIVELLTVPQYERGIQNVRELSESNLSIIIRNELKIAFFDPFDLEYDDVSHKISTLLRTTDEREMDEVFFDCIKTDEGCAAFFVGDEDFFDDSISEVAHLIWENSVVGSISYVFFTLKHSYLF
ncbi:hypothetical protein FQR65_LT04272 [Abscondita terminalis]|nr:hypothetical protein FQR65_LT04272 [Abscondita terminalis]